MGDTVSLFLLNQSLWKTRAISIKSIAPITWMVTLLATLRPSAITKVRT